MKRLVRSSDRMVSGVLGGIANYFEIDSAWTRLGFVLFALIYNIPIAIILYVVGLILVPHDSNITQAPTDSHYDRSDSNRRLFTIVGVILIGLGVIFLLEQLANFDFWWYFNNLFSRLKKFVVPVVLIILGVWIIIRGKKGKK